MSTNGQKVISTAERYTWVHETSPNSSPQIDKWEARWGLHDEPWCGIWEDAMFSEADVSDSGVCHPSTAEMCRRASNIGAWWNGVGQIPMGAIWIDCGIHTCLVIRDLGDGSVYTIEGNHNNAVGFGHRHISDGRIIVLPAIKADSKPPPPKYEYWIEDVKAKQTVYGKNGKYARWKEKAARDKVLRQMIHDKKWAKYHPRAMSHDGWFYIRLGPLKYYGPYQSESNRDHAMGLLKLRLHRQLRPFRRTV